MISRSNWHRSPLWSLRLANRVCAHVGPLICWTVVRCFRVISVPTPSNLQLLRPSLASKLFIVSFEVLLIASVGVVSIVGDVAGRPWARKLWNLLSAARRWDVNERRNYKVLVFNCSVLSPNVERDIAERIQEERSVERSQTHVRYVER